MQGHQHATLERLRAHRIVLALQDTTSLNYSTHRATQGLAPISTRGHRTVGLLSHSTLAVTPTGQALGLIHHRCQARSEGGSAKERHQKPVEQKESVKWLQSLKACQPLAPQCPQTLLLCAGAGERSANSGRNEVVSDIKPIPPRYLGGKGVRTDS